MKKVVFLLITALFYGCADDPSADEILFSQKLDIERMEGEVISKTVSYYEGDRSETIEKKGEPYYSITICTGGKVNAYKGVPVHIFDSVTAGCKLPMALVMDVKRIANESGKIADKGIDWPKRKFYIVIEGYDGKKRIFEVDSDLYYNEKLIVGATLPMMLEEAEVYKKPANG